MNTKPSTPADHKPLGHGEDPQGKQSRVGELAGHKPSPWALPWDVKVELARIRLQMAERRYIADRRKANPRH